MNAIFLCVFHQRKYVDMAFLLLDSLQRFGELGDDTEILIYTSTEFSHVIRDSPLMSDRIRFEINDGYDTVTTACKSRLDLFGLASTVRYGKILYLDTDIIVKNDVHRVFDLVTDDLLYVLAEGRIDDPSQSWGASLFGPESANYPDKTAFCSGILAFRNCDTIRDLFDAIKADIVDRPRPSPPHDQPYFVYNAFKYGVFDNQVMKRVAVNDCDHYYSDMVIHHFPGGAGIYGPKIGKMQKLLHEVKRWRSLDPATAAGSGPTASPALAMSRRLLKRLTGSGSFALPAVPGLLEEYVNVCEQTFGAQGVRMRSAEISQLRDLLAEQLGEAYARAPRSEVVVAYDVLPGGQVTYTVNSRWLLGDRPSRYGDDAQSSPLSGTEPDARVWALACEEADPATAPILTVGGRNSLALARRGHPVVAVQTLAADALRETARRESLDLRIIDGGLSGGGGDGPVADLGRGYRLIALSGVVSEFERPEQLRALFELATHRLAPGGALAFNAFLGRAGYSPDAAAREFGRQYGSAALSYAEMDAAAAGLGLELEADDPVLDVEKRAATPGSWPPDRWYEDWVSGLDVFSATREESPIEMRWLVYRKTG